MMDRRISWGGAVLLFLAAAIWILALTGKYIHPRTEVSWEQIIEMKVTAIAMLIVGIWWADPDTEER